MFEGIGGAGKSTQLKIVKDILEKKGNSVLAITEFSDSEIGNFLKSNIRKSENFRIELEYENSFFLTHLLVAAEQINQYNLIDDAKNYDYIFFDRFHLSNIAHIIGDLPQNFPIELEGSMIRNFKLLMGNFIDRFEPKAIYFQVDIETARHRILKRNGSAISLEQGIFLENLNDAYEKVIEIEKTIYVNANLSIEQVTKQILRAITK